MKYLFSLLIIGLSLNVFGQELNLAVKVSAPSVTQTDGNIIKKLEQEVTNLMNNTNWTEREYDAVERIQGNLQINILKELGSNSFEAEMIVKSSRPVYNGTYTSSLVNLIDKGVSFSYDGIAPLTKSTDGYVDNLSSILSFYAYFIIGMDDDSFERSGGNPSFNQAQDIYTNLPSNVKGSPGWDSNDSRQQSRYWLIENMLSPKFRPYRESIYEYHRLGMDKMYEDNARARAVMISALTAIGEVNANYNNAVILKMFSDAKRQELFDIFSVAESGQKRRVKNIMTAIDPSQSSKFKDFR